MNHSEFFKSLKSGEILPVYLFCGQEQYVLRSALKQLESTVVSDDLKDVNLTVLPETASGSDICAACETFPFLADKRMVVVEGSAFLAAAGKSEGEEQLIEYLKNPSDFTVLVFVSPQPDKRKKLYKALAEHTVVDFSVLSDSELKKWIEKILRGFSLTIEPAALDFLLEYADARPDALISELEKLAAYKMNGTVTKADILDIITPCNEYNVFKLTDAIHQRDRKAALTLLSGMLANREEPLLILGVISKHMRLLVRLKTLMAENVPRQEAMKLLDVKEFQYKRFEAECKGRSLTQLKKAMDLCYSCDTGLKTGAAFDEAALHALILNLISLQEG